MRFLMATLLTFLIVIILGGQASAAEGFNGTLIFRTGESVEFNYIGDLDRVGETLIQGKIGAQNVRLKFEELKEIVFSETGKDYGDYPGSLIIVNRQGERFTVTNAQIYAGGGSEWIHYVYNDPVTKKLKATRATIKNNVSHITIGRSSGDIKKNPGTGEYFPALYIYDPFTGEKLVWSKRAE